MRPSIVLALMLLVPLSGCDFKAKLDMEKLEKHIEEEVEDQTDHKVKSVKCPKEVVEEKGETFKCTIKTKSGEKIKVEVKMKGDGNVSWETKNKDDKDKDEDEDEDE